MDFPSDFFNHYPRGEAYTKSFFEETARWKEEGLKQLLSKGKVTIFFDNEIENVSVGIKLGVRTIYVPSQESWEMIAKELEVKL